MLASDEEYIDILGGQLNNTSVGRIITVFRIEPREKRLLLIDLNVLNSITPLTDHQWQQFAEIRRKRKQFWDNLDSANKLSQVLSLD